MTLRQDRVEMDTGTITGSPTSAYDIVNKAYIDTLDLGSSVVAVTTAALTPGPATYLAGVLTAAGNGALSIDGVSPSVNQRVYVSEQATPMHNGLYIVTDAGSAGTPWILTRSADFAVGADVAGKIVPVEGGGTTNANKLFVVTNATGLATIDTDVLVIEQFGVRGANDAANKGCYPTFNGSKGFNNKPMASQVIDAIAMHVDSGAKIVDYTLNSGGTPELVVHAAQLTLDNEGATCVFHLDHGVAWADRIVTVAFDIVPMGDSEGVDFDYLVYKNGVLATAEVAGAAAQGTIADVGATGTVQRAEYALTLPHDDDIDTLVVTIRKTTGTAIVYVLSASLEV